MKKETVFIVLLSAIVFAKTEDVFGQQARKPIVHGPEGSELSVSVGAPSGVGTIVDLFRFTIEGIAYSFQDNRKAQNKFIGTYGLDYYYQVNSWFRPGIKATYEGVRTTLYDSNNVNINRYYTSMVTVMPSVQFSYLNRRLVKLYSGIDVGIGFFFGNNTNSENSSPNLSPSVAFNITPIGIRVGNEHVFGLVETNIGFDALVKAGFGVRF